MTMARVFTNEEMEEWLRMQPEVMALWKGVIARGGFYVVWDFCPKKYELYGNGFIEAERVLTKNGAKYWSGYHFCESKKAAHNYFQTFLDMCPHISFYFIKCLVKKEWITAIGEGESGFTIVASKAIFPHYPETEARYEDLPQETQEAVAMFARMERDTK